MQESLKLLYREVEDEDELEEDGAAGGGEGGGAELWNEQTYQHVDVIAADHVFTDNSDAVVNTETRSVPVTTGQSLVISSSSSSSSSSLYRPFIVRLLQHVRLHKCIKTIDYALRNSENSCVLPQCNLSAFKRSFINWSLFAL